MKRIVSICLPHWPIERLVVAQARQSPSSAVAPSKSVALQEVCDEVPFALVESGHRGVRLSAVNRTAFNCGLKAGDALADARTRVPDLKVCDAQAQLDRDGIRRLARWLGRYGIQRNAYGIADKSPSGHPIRQYGVWIDISGVAHLYGGEAELLDDIETRLEGLGLTVATGLADTFGAAHALAWYRGGRSKGPSRIAVPNDTLAAIAHLPVAALRLDGARVHLLHRLGFKTIGSLARVPRIALERRFRSPDESQRVMLRLDQALGLKAEPRRPLVEQPVVSVRQPFAEPLMSAEPLDNEVRDAVARLCERLDVANLGVRCVQLSLYRCDGTIGEVSVRLSRAVRTPEHLTGLLFEKLPALDLGFGVDLLVLEAIATEQLVSDQQSLTQDRGIAQEAAHGRLIDRLVNRLGAGQVIQLAAQESHWPECAQIRQPARVTCQKSFREPSGRPDRMDLSQPGSAHRPALLLAPPEQVTVIAEIPEGAPVQFSWRRVRYAVVRSQGPERIEPEWWKQLWPAPGLRSRDYYVLEDQTGARFWVYRDGRYDGETDDAPPGWFVHGVFA